MRNTSQFRGIQWLVRTFYAGRVAVSPLCNASGLRGKIVGPTLLEGDQVRQLPAQRRQLFGVLIKHSTMASVMPSVSNKRYNVEQIALLLAVRGGNQPAGIELGRIQGRALSGQDGAAERHTDFAFYLAASLAISLVSPRSLLRIRRV